ncbi:MAG: GAF domain-containing protein [Calditrichaeota bacterium]|nr:GAF domain-containing protein [Calditrichota bacterium]
MLISLINFALTTSVALPILLLWLLISQKKKEIYFSIYIYLAILVSIDALATLILLNTRNPETAHLSAKIRLITESFIIAILFYLTKTVDLFTNIPRPSLKNTLVFSGAALIAVLGLLNLMIEDITFTGQYYFPVFSSYYWVTILFYFLIFYLIFVDIVSKYRRSRRKQEIQDVREILVAIFPLTFLSTLILYILPYWTVAHPLIFLAYLIPPFILFYCALRFYIIETDSRIQYLVPLMLFFLLVALAVFHYLNVSQRLPLLLMSIPFFIGTVILSHLVTQQLFRWIRKFQVDVDAGLDKKIEEFSSEIVKFIDQESLLKFVGDFCQETLQFNKCAILTLQYDVPPYQISYFTNFDRAQFQQMLESGHSPILELLEDQKTVINKFSFAPESVIYQLLDRLDVYLVLPIMGKKELMGIVFLGGSRKQTKISERQIQFLKIISTQVGIALENIRTLHQTIQSQKMAEIGMLASQLAHDFQSFITIVKLENSNNDRLKQHAQYMEKLVQDLLNYARPQELKLTPVKINHLIDMSLDLVEIPPDILIEKHYSEDLPEIQVDVGQMRRVFTNLFENSIHAMRNSREKRLKITTRPLRPLTKLKRSPWIYIEILDEGEGIPEEYLDKIFEPFFTTHKQDGGTGMGLAIVKQIITRHNGFIDVTSKPGKGTIFNIRLPYLIKGGS